MNTRGQVNGPTPVFPMLLTVVTAVMAYNGYQDPFITGSSVIDAVLMGAFGFVGGVGAILLVGVMIEVCIRGGLFVLERIVDVEDAP